jgi:hypothetical protein
MGQSTKSARRPKEIMGIKFYICGDHVHFFMEFFIADDVEHSIPAEPSQPERIPIIRRGTAGSVKKVKRKRMQKLLCREEVILQKIAEALGTETFCKDAFDEHVDKVIVTDGDVRVIPKKH